MRLGQANIASYGDIDVMIYVEWKVLSGLTASTDHTRKTLWSCRLVDFPLCLVLCHGVKIRCGKQFDELQKTGLACGGEGGRFLLLGSMLAVKHHTKWQQVVVKERGLSLGVENNKL